MTMFKRGCVVLLLISAAACGGRNPSPAAPSTPSAAPAPVPRPTSTFHLTGIVTDDDHNPVAGATVTTYRQVLAIPDWSVSGMTDGRGFYSLDFDAYSDGNLFGSVTAESAGHDQSYYGISSASGSQDISQNLHLYRIKRITAGESTVLTVLPSDPVCGFSLYEFVCRTVHILAPSDGLMTIEAVTTLSAANALLAILGPSASASRCCSLTASVPVSAGTEVIASVGPNNATASQSFVLNTSLVPP